MYLYFIVAFFGVAIAALRFAGHFVNKHELKEKARIHG